MYFMDIIVKLVEAALTSLIEWWSNLRGLTGGSREIAQNNSPVCLDIIENATKKSSQSMIRTICNSFGEG